MPSSAAPRVALALAFTLGTAAAAPAGRASEAEPSPAEAQPARDPHNAPPHDALAGPHDALAGPHDALAGPHDALAGQLDAETGSVDRAIDAVEAKLAAAEHTRRARLRAAVRALHAAPDDDAMVVARRRAAARLLLERDGGERALLIDELAQLRAAHDRIAAELTQLASIVIPHDLVRPARGKIVRHFGVLVHERSRATLSRRGLDLEVDEHSPVVAPAAGTVRYAGPIRGLDQGVILDHGGYLTVVGKLAELALPVGAPIAAGDRLGRAARRRVYFEVRVKLGPGGLPIDPEPLLGKSR